MNMPIDFTVAICTYNGEQRLPEVLDCLRSQLYTENITWEVIVVDNNSTDNTFTIVRNYQKLTDNVAVRYYFESQQGAAFARKHAISVAKSELIGFLDDDNLPNANWVAAAYQFAQNYPHAGAYGSQIHPDWEVQPPENFHRIAPFLAITERGIKPLKYDQHSKLLPPSAGLVVRRSAWLATVPPECILTGRTQDSMLTSEDLEVLSYIQLAGWEIWYNPAMEIYHKIPRWRLQKEYLIPFFRGIGLSRHVTRMVNVKPIWIPLAVAAYMLNDLRKLILHLFKYRSAVIQDVVAACEIQLILSSLFSPFYIWKYRYFQGNSSRFKY